VAAFVAVFSITFAASVWLLSRDADASDCGTPGCSTASDLAFDTEDLDFILKYVDDLRAVYMVKHDEVVEIAVS